MRFAREGCRSWPSPVRSSLRRDAVAARRSATARSSRSRGPAAARAPGGASASHGRRAPTDPKAGSPREKDDQPLPGPRCHRVFSSSVDGVAGDRRGPDRSDRGCRAGGSTSIRGGATVPDAGGARACDVQFAGRDQPAGRTWLCRSPMLRTSASVAGLRIDRPSAKASRTGSSLTGSRHAHDATSPELNPPASRRASSSNTPPRFRSRTARDAGSEASAASATGPSPGGTRRRRRTVARLRRRG